MKGERFLWAVEYQVIALLSVFCHVLYNLHCCIKFDRRDDGLGLSELNATIKNFHQNET